MKRLHAVALKLVSAAAASGMPSTWEVLSAVTRAATEAPQAASIAKPTARIGGEVIRPWPKAVDARLAAIRALYNMAK